MTVEHNTTRLVEPTTDQSSIAAQRGFVDLLSRDPAMVSGNLDIAARLVTEYCARLLAIERVGVWLFDESESELRCIDQFNLSSGRHSSGAILQEHEFRPEFEALKSSLYVDASHPLTDPRTAGYVEGYLKPHRITSMLDSVIRFGGKNLGVLCFEHVDNPHVWRQHEIGFACLVGTQLSILMERQALQRVETAQRETQQRLRATMELDELKSRFFANISHELRTPLTLMLAPIEDVLNDANEPPTPRQREQLELVHRNATRLLTLVNALLSFARFEAGRVQAVFEPTDLSRLTRDVAGQFASLVSTAGLRMRIECEPIAEAAYVDRGMWEQVVLNLVSNAVKYTFTGEIVVRLRASNEGFELEVSDTGIGIPPEALPHVFERFYRVHGARARSAEGSGIGLALVRDIVELHGGTVSVESRFGQGSTFRVSLPRGSAHLSREHVRAGGAPLEQRRASAVVHQVESWLAPSAKPERAEARPAAERARVLVVEDNADMRAYAARILSERYDVQAVCDGVEALAAVRARRPDLVLSDVMMPGLDGMGLLRALRADERTATIPVLLLSARAGDEALVEAFASGADDYVAKPFSSRELVARVDTHLALVRARREAAESRFKDVFLAIASHELRTPLTALSLRVAHASRQLEQLGAALAAQKLSVVRRSIARMERLVNDMLDASAVKAGQLPVRRERCDLVEICRDGVAQIELLFARSIDCALPPSPVFAMVDRERIGEVVENLLGNALKFTPAESKVRLSLRASGDGAEIVVRDEGPGIAAEDLPHIFDQFYRAADTKIEAGSAVGLGLGLYVARAIVEQHGGRIAVESEVGKGTTFRVVLPLGA